MTAIHPHESIATQKHGQPAGAHSLLWRLGNLLLIAGGYLLLYVGGLYADGEYERYAARGDNNLPPSAAVISLAPSEPNAFTAPVLNQQGEQAPAQSSSGQLDYSTITRLVAPAIGVDSKVIQVGWEVVEENGQQVAIWNVAKYAVGHHQGSANPGEGENIVLAGHVGGEAPVFKDLIGLEPGHQIILYSQGRQYLYVVADSQRVQEIGVSDEQRRANAQLIGPTGREMVTLVSCWPPAGPNKFEQRLVVRAVPYAPHDIGGGSSWSPR